MADDPGRAPGVFLEIKYKSRQVDRQRDHPHQRHRRHFIRNVIRNGQKHDFEGWIAGDGVINVDGQNFPSLSYAAIYCIQKAGSKRETVNGWTSWKNSAGVLLAEIRKQYLEK